MIIGISGKKSHGKDTVAKLINIAIVQSTTPNSTINLEKIVKHYDAYNQHIMGWPYQKKMFAYKVKEIVCMLINCTMEQLEDQAFKEKPLGEEWRVWYWGYYKLKSNRHPDGRQSDLFFTNEEAQKDLQDFFSKISDNPDFKGPVEGYFVDTYLPTPRLLLQLVGTECGRKIIHPNVWVNALMSEYKPIVVQHKETARHVGIDEWIVPNYDHIPEHLHGRPVQGDIFEWVEEKGIPNWIITDVRFPNEIKTIKEKEGLIVRVNRPGLDDSSTHESEILLDDYPHFDAVFDNSSIDYLFSQVKVFLKNKNLI